MMKSMIKVLKQLDEDLFKPSRNLLLDNLKNILNLKNNMSIFNKTQNGQVSFDTRQQMNTKQKSILTMSFVKAGLGFLIIGVLSFLFGLI